MLEFYNLQKHRARKKYICDICTDAINTGEQYIRYSGKYDGDLFDCKYHLTCNEIAREFCDAVGEVEYDTDSIHYWLRDDICRKICDEEIRDDCLYTPMRCKRILDYFGLGNKKECV